MRFSSQWVIAREKLTQYLLLPKEVDDKSKFLAQAGFTPINVDSLEAALRKLVQTYEPIYDLTNEYGDFYRVEGELIGPLGKLAVVTIWIAKRKGTGEFHFVTLKPK